MAAKLFEHLDILMLSTMITSLLAFAVVSAPLDFAKEGNRITSKTISTFYDSRAKIWKPPFESSEAVGDQGYTFWPSLLAWQAIIEGAKVDPKKWKAKVGPFYDVLEQYFDKKGHAYCAWTYFPGNDDKFYDDNTWAAVACMEAYQVTGEKRYRDRAIEIFDKFVVNGWDSTGKPGGLRWGTKAGLEDRNDKTVSATAAGALAATLISSVHDRKAKLAWAKLALDWIRDKLSTKDGLIYDGFKAPGFERMGTVWTYNTGVPIRAAVTYAKAANDRSYRLWAVKMGNACLDRELSPMYDGAVEDRSKRYWWDAVYFVQYLTDGMRSLSLATGDKRFVGEARREAIYVHDYLLAKDGLYWRNMRLWTIDAERQRVFLSFSGQSGPALTADSSERSLEPDELKKPVEQRRMAGSAPR